MRVRIMSIKMRINIMRSTANIEKVTGIAANVFFIIIIR